jgi:large subunit ribosomal protein L25
MATATLTATPRAETGKGAARKLRSSERIPAVVYGHHREPQSLAVPTHDLERLLERTAGETTIVELTLEGQTVRTLIREIQRHPYKRQILHVDFQELVAGETVSIELPIRLVGTAVGVRVSGGILDQVMHQLTIEVDPADMPNYLDVDVSNLGINDAVHVGDLPLPPGVRALADAEATVCIVSPPRVHEEVAVAEVTEATAEPEVIRKSKAEETEGSE